MMPSKSIYRDIYNLHADCIPRLREPDFWDSVFYPKIEAMTERYNNAPFLIDMLVAVHGDLERRYKEIGNV